MEEEEIVTVILDPPQTNPGPGGRYAQFAHNDRIAGTPSLAALRRAQAAIQCRIAQLGKTMSVDEE